MSGWRVPLTTLELPEGDVQAVLETLRSGWLTMGPRTEELEGAFAEWMGARHAVAVSSGTAGLHLACLAAGVQRGDEVIVPALSFVADAHAPRYCGAEPVFVDSQGPLDPLLDPRDVERRITERTTAVVAVHMFGYTAPVEALAALCDRHGIRLIEDCCEAAGAILPSGARAGTAGIAGCFSFFSKTQLGVGEGGIVVTDDEAFAQRIRLLRSHAMSSVTWDRHRGHAETYDISDLGFNFRIDEPRATLARRRLARLDDALAELRRVASSYRKALGGSMGLTIPFEDEAVARSGHFAFPVLVGDRRSRDAIRERLHGSGVQSTFYPALTQLSAYKPDGDSACPNAEEFADRHLVLPFSPALDEERIGIVVDELRAALEQCSDGRAADAGRPRKNAAGGSRRGP